MKKTGKSMEKDNEGKQEGGNSSPLLMVNKGKQVQVFAGHHYPLPESSSSSAPVPMPQFPPGFRFSPTESELIIHYLQKKVMGIPINYVYSPIVERDLYGNEEPSQICPALGKAEHEDFHVFTLLRSKSGGSHMARQAGNGTWKGDHRPKPVYDENDMTTLIGYKTTLTFFHNMTKRTSWIMHQYTLPDQQQSWSLCRIHNEVEAKTKRKFSAVTSSPQHPISVPSSSSQAIIHESPVPAAKRPRTNDHTPSPSSQPTQTPLHSTGFLSFLLSDVDYYQDMDALLDSSHTASFQNAYDNFASLLSPAPAPASHITLSELSATNFASTSSSHPQ